MTDEVNIEVNGVPMKARKGAMIIHVTDAHDVYVPRFCYHDKLPIAANCRMCLVEVEKAPKPMPACATPVMEGMKIFTKSPKAIAAQKAVMEFLLINHPLDCPICDQGGECELQDLAMGFGKDASRYAERKRVVKDKNIGPLISTDMTRCIHCTRCVRFTKDVAGYQELGTVGRGETTEISTFIEQSVNHELSANIIDLCPVGALNNKPFRYHARAWEMTQHPLVSPHDAIGSNLFAHVLRGRVMRIVPRPNEAINETWISDRDRFSYEGFYSDDRITSPMVREGNEWKTVSWDVALQLAADKLGKIASDSSQQIGALASPTSTLEELHLFAKIVRGLGSANLDHRLRRGDFRDQSSDPMFPWLGCSLADVESLNAALIVGSNLRKEAPILAHRVRKAASNGAKVSFINPAKYEYLFPVANYLTSNGHGMVEHLAAVLSAACQVSGSAIPQVLQSIVASAQVNDAHRAIAAQLSQGANRLVLLGAIAERSADFSVIRALAAAIATSTGAKLGYLPEGGNAVGAYLAGVVPHREVAGVASSTSGMNVAEMLSARLKAYVLLGAIEPDKDIVGPALDALRLAECVIALTPYATAKDYAHIILPISVFAETSGTYVNLEGTWQSVPGAAKPLGDARPGWKVLRVLGNLLNLSGFDYVSPEQVRDELKARAYDVQPNNHYSYQGVLSHTGSERVNDVPMYAVDAMVRRANALQLTQEALSSNESGAGS
jgi:NADH-quinone oxidoreductase subunit G